MHPNIIAPRISSNLFQYDQMGKLFQTEMSTLQHNGANPLSQFYNDSCDVGFIMVSAKTGYEAPFFLFDTMTNRDGDETEYILRVDPAAVLRRPALEGVEIRIWNT